ncbi:unnamed protein product [Rhizophagus irregularis]|nr:unnamed protein product [Rhizophagus irregularis]
MTSNRTYLPPGLETRLAEQNQVERRRNAYNVLINNEDNEKRIKNLPRQSILDPLWDQFFNGGAAISSKCNEGLSMQGDTNTLAQNESTEKEAETNLFFSKMTMMNLMQGLGLLC